MSMVTGSQDDGEIERRRESLRQVGDTVLYDLMRDACIHLGGTYVYLSDREEQAGGDGTQWDQLAMRLDKESDAIVARDREAQIEAILRWDAERRRLDAEYPL